MTKIAPGREKPLELSSFILLSPESVLKLDGTSFSGLYAELGRANQWRHFQRLLSRPGLTRAQLRYAFKPMLRDLQTEGVDTGELDAALDDPAAANRINQMGLWGVVREAFCSDVPDGQSWVDPFVSIETESRPLDEALQRLDFQEVVAMGRRSESLRGYLSEAAWNRLEVAHTASEALPPRMVGVLEALLANFAWTERNLARTEADRTEFQELMRGQDEKDIGRWLMRRLQEAVGATNQAELFRLSRPNGCQPGPVDERTLKRWVSGASLPSRKKFLAAAAHMHQQRHTDGGQTLNLDRTGSVYRVAHRLVALLRLTEPLWGEGSARAAQRDWVSLIGFERRQEWLERRYAHWLEAKPPQATD